MCLILCGKFYFLYSRIRSILKQQTACLCYPLMKQLVLSHFCFKCKSTCLQSHLPKYIIPYKSFCSLECSGKARTVILGIETSCDDTGCAIVDSNCNILGEALHSQQQIHINHGGIIPPIARDLHVQYIKKTVSDALSNANMQLSDLDAIATTVKPGLLLSLLVGTKYGKHLAKTSGKPFMPIHHMEAHALTVRMVQKVEFPFLVLLISGGHCLLAVAKSVDKFLLLGQTLDTAPGEAFDKAARRLKLSNLPEYETLSGGAAIERAAMKGDPLAFEFPAIMSKFYDCNFSFSGVKEKILRYILRLEKKHDIKGDGMIPELHDLCASFQWGVGRHLCHKVQRGMDYVSRRELLSEDNKTLVVSGGVACNKFIISTLGRLCEAYGYKIAVPPPRLCTDNGIMIAWNGIERWKAGIGIAEDLEAVDAEARCPFGDDITNDVRDANIRCLRIKQKVLLGL